MTRNIMREAIKQRLEDYQIPLTDESKEVAEAAVDCALEHLLGFLMQLSEQLTVDNAYSEAMVAGIVIRKVKGLLGK